MTRALLTSIALASGLLLLLGASLLWVSIPDYIRAPDWQTEQVPAYRALAAIENATGRAFILHHDGRITFEIESEGLNDD
jgi:hypothetical protein